MFEVTKKRNINMAKIRQIFPKIPFIKSELDKQVEIDAQIQWLPRCQARDIQRFKKDESILIPNNFNYSS